LSKLAIAKKSTSIPAVSKQLNKYLLERLSDSVLALITSFCFANALITTLSFDYSPVFVLYIVSIFMVIFNIIFFSKRTTLIFAGSSVTFVILYIIYLVIKENLAGNNENLTEIIERFNSVFVWFIDYLNGYEQLDKNYAFLIALFICCIITILVYIFTVKYFNFYLILSGGILIFVIQIMMNYYISFLSFYLFIALAIVYYFKYIYINKSKSEENNYIRKSVFTVFSLPIVMVIFVVSFYLPKSDKPIEWKWLDDKIIAWFDFYNEKFRFASYEYFSFSSTGFGKDVGRLGGKVDLDDTPVMEVETPNRTYLRGAIRDVYTGISWTNSQNLFTKYNNNNESNTENEIQYDIIEPLIGMALFKDSHDLENENLNNISSNMSDNVSDIINNIIKRSNLKIRYLNLRTKTIFTPTKTLKINTLGKYNGSIFYDTEGIFSGESRLNKGFEYELEVYNINYNDEIFKEFIKKSYIGLYNHILNENYKLNKDINIQTLFENEIEIDSKNIRINMDDIKKLADISTDIYSRYLQLPDTLPKRIKQIALSITENFNNNYDKVKAIENYLASKYPYTLKPKPTPNGRDFTDYFLFDLKEGYCIYYATAMVVMLRSIGIPARYVEGYMLPPEAVYVKEHNNSTDSDNSIKVYRVTNENAHAWVEVYFEGFGWIPFEPTAPFTSSFYRSDDYTGSLSPDFMEDPFYLEYLMMLEEYESVGLENVNLPKRLPEDEIILPSYNYKIIMISFAVLILILFTSIIIFNIIKSKMFIRKIMNAEPKECIINLTNFYFRIFDAMGFIIQNNETPMEYIKRIEEKFAYDKYKYDNETFENFKARVGNPESLSKHSGLLPVAEVYQLARYSKEQMNKEQKNTVLEYYPKIIAEAKDTLGFIKYFAYRYLLGRF